MLSRLRTPVYKNSGSVARDHLAAERTFLSWVRTALGFVAFGVAVERFSQLDLTALKSNATFDTSKEAEEREERKIETQGLVVGLIGTGIGTLAYGTTRYYSNMRMLEQGLFKPSFHGAGGLTLAVTGLSGAAYWAIVRQPSSSKD
ncbi:MAG: hypothetical protein M1820_003454 [Bogoriella megaspora]|nr:MAG: hypothetical protein M1820_003454 [Bogoriella megaspora]